MAQNVYTVNDDGGMAMSAPSGYYNWNVYDGPTNYLRRIVSGTALDGELPILPSPAPNASYVLSYPAPSLQCTAMPVSVLQAWAPVMNCDPTLPFDGSANNFSACDTNPNDDYYWPYLAWTPASGGIVPFANGSLLIAEDLPLSSVLADGGSPYLGSYNSSAANLFIAPMHVSANMTNIEAFPLNCSLYNASYAVNFTFQQGVQTISVLEVNLTNPIAPLLITPQRLHGQNASGNVGINMNYQAIMDSLGRLLIGDIGRTGDVYQTQILQTELAFTREMYPIFTGGLDPASINSTTSKWYQRPLAEAVEDLFQNMTLSLFSRNDFLRVSDAVTTNVTTTTLQNVYAYNWERLWLAYGLALGFTVIVVTLGCGSLVIAGTSYSNKLSTTLRITGGDKVDVDVKDVDRSGNDPLPEYLSEAKLSCKEMAFERSELENAPQTAYKSGATDHLVTIRSSYSRDEDS